jgi:hypothetical protein
MNPAAKTKQTANGRENGNRRLVFVSRPFAFIRVHFAVRLSVAPDGVKGVQSVHGCGG